MQFYGYRAAETAAIAHSQRNPSATYYVNWVEDNEWVVDTHPEFDGQPGWRAGLPTVDEPLLPDTSGMAIWLTDRSALTPRR